MGRAVNIYLKMEIKARELEGRMLLGLIAAERGHTVVLGELRPVVREAPDAPPGVYHDTCLYPSAGQTRLRQELRGRGWSVTSQDEEHGLLEPTYENYARKRYSEENLQLAARVFAWGPHDSAALRQVYPASADRVEVVGSPRIDLNRAAFESFFRARSKPGLAPGQPYVLFANNFTRVIGVNRIDTFVRHMRNARYFEGDDDPFEYLQYEEAAAQMDFLPHMIRAIRQVAKQHPDLTVVVRPHPQETESSWRDLIGPVPNVLVSGHGDIGRWMRGAFAVVQSGDTTAFEATVAGVPLVAFTPVRGDHHWAARFANQLGWTAETVDELLDLIRAIKDGSVDHEALLDRDRALLAERITVFDDRLAADAIVDAWETHDGGGPSTTTLAEVAQRTRRWRAEWRAREIARPAVSGARTLARRASIRGGEPPVTLYRTAQKFPAITAREVDELVAGYRTALGRFEGVRATMLGPRLVGLERDGV
jgi:surface carbohydrate biosynthesis protein